MKQTIFYISLFISCLTSCINKQPEQNKNTTMANSIHFESGYSDVNGIKMYYEIHGQGQPLVLIHGGGSTLTTSFGKITPMLAENYKAIAVELQAHGRTSDRNSPVSFQQDADDVARLLKNLQIQKSKRTRIRLDVWWPAGSGWGEASRRSEGDFAARPRLTGARRWLAYSARITGRRQQGPDLAS